MIHANGTQDNRTRRLGWIASAVVLLGSLAPAVPAAQAYDASTCGSGTSWDDVDQFGVNLGVVDFGDDLHLGGTPRGTAVACWDGNVQNGTASKVTLTGKLYRDSGSSEPCASIEVLFLDGAAGVRARHRPPELCGPGGLRSRVVNVTVNVPVNRIRILLYRGNGSCCEIQQLQRVLNVRFGD
jgi:hypothetical protein